MNIIAKIFKSSFAAECLNKPVRFGSDGQKIGRIIDSKIDNDSLIIRIKIYKRWRKKMNELFRSGLYAYYSLNDNNFQLESVELKPADKEAL